VREVRRGDNQRSQLKGFARLRAILWPRSLRFVEVWNLGRQSWYWRLRWNLWREFQGVDLHHPARIQGDSDIFGETPILTVVRLLDLARAVGPNQPTTFVDLGSGRGTTCLTAGFLGFQAIGYEKEVAWAQKAETVTHILGLDCHFKGLDFLSEPWPEKAVFFVVGTAFDSDLRNRLLDRFGELDSGSLIIAGDWALPDSYQTIWSGPLPVDWGIVPFSIYRT
jgi:hypothetical protein